MAVQDREVAAPAAAREGLAALPARLREIADLGAYREVALAARYPVAAMLISQSLLTLVALAVLNRFLGREGFGQYALVLSITATFQVIAAFPAEKGTPKFLPEARQAGLGEERAYYAASFLIKLTAGVIAIGAAVLGADRVTGLVTGQYHQSGLHSPVLIAALSLCLLAPISDFFLSCVQGMEQPGRWATGNLLTSFVVFPLTVVGAAYSRRYGLTGVFVAIAAGWLLAVAVNGVLARRALEFLWPTPLLWAKVRELILFLLPMWVVPVVGFGTRTTLKLYLAHKCGAVPVGQFENAVRLLEHMGTIYQACMIVFTPAWARLYAAREGAELLRSISRVRGALLGAALVYGAALTLGGQWVVPAIFGADQVGAVPAARIMGIAMPVMISGWVASVTYVISNRTRNIGMANIVWVSIAIPLGLALTPRLGALGTALAWLGAYIVFAWYYISRARPFFREVEGWVSQATAAEGATAASVSGGGVDGIKKV